MIETHSDELHRHEEEISGLQRSATVMQIIQAVIGIGFLFVVGGGWTYLHTSLNDVAIQQLTTKVTDLNTLQSRVQTVEAQNKAIDRLSANFDILVNKIEVISNKQTEMATQLQQLLSKR